MLLKLKMKVSAVADQEFPREGAPTPKEPINFPEKCMEMKILGPGGYVQNSDPPLRNSFIFSTPLFIEHVRLTLYISHAISTLFFKTLKQ